MKTFYQNIFYDANGVAKVQALNSPLFYIGLGIKILLGIFLASPYLTDLFIPFINTAVHHGEAYVQGHESSLEFPYPGLMHAIFYLPHKLFEVLGILPNKATFLHLFLFRVTCLIFDFSIFLVLLRWLRNAQRKVLIYYWLSPILIYITYIHGQLDVVPIALLIVSLYFLFKERFLLFSLFLALGICTKTSIALALPFVLIYRFRYTQPSLSQALKEFLIFIGPILLFNIPYWSEQYFQMVYNNEVQTRMFNASLNFGQGRSFLFIPAVILIQTIIMISRKWVSRDLLLLFMAFSFGTLTLLIIPMQGWYYWIIPFFVYFIIKFNGEARWLFLLLNVAFFFYFAIIPQSEFLNLYLMRSNKDTIYQLLNLSNLHVNVAFTILQTLLLLFLIILYQKGIKSHINKKLFSQPMLIGLSGDSGSGKSTLTSNLLQVFGDNNTTIIRGDDMHKWERGNKNWKSITHLNPKANRLSEDLEQLKQLKDGYSIYRQQYNHDNGKFTLPFQIKSNRLVIFEGLHSFYLRSQGSLYDLKIYLDPASQILLRRKIKRDVDERGKAENEVLQQIKEREQDSKLFVQSQKEMADIVIQQQEEEGIEFIKITLPADVALDDILALLHQNTQLSIQHEFLENNQQSISLKGEVSQVIIESIANETFGMLSELGINNAQWESDEKGLIQLIIIACIMNKV